MVQFYFNVIASSGERIEDLEGSNLTDLKHAKSEAITDARSLMSTAILRGIDISNYTMQICNSEGNIVDSFSFRDTIRRTIE